jgi:hypothetical protein
MYGDKTIMSYCERLKFWVLVRQLPSRSWVTIARFSRRADADGHLAYLQRVLPDVPFTVVFMLADDRGDRP